MIRNYLTESIIKIISTLYFLIGSNYALSRTGLYQFHSCKTADLPVLSYDYKTICVYENIRPIQNAKLIIEDNYIYAMATEIRFENCSIPNLTNDFFANKYNVRRIDFSRANIQTLSQDIFYQSIDLIGVNMSHNSIKELPSNLFKRNSRLRGLDASHNQISSVEFLSGVAGSLEVLLLSHNKIVDLGNTFEFNQNKFIILRLDNNLIETFPEELLDGQNQLSQLLLNDNPIKNNLEYEKYFKLENLIDINLSNITMIPSHIMVNTVETKVNNCNLTEITIGKKVIILKAANNWISKVIIQSINSSISEIDLSYNNLSSIINITNLYGLKKLDISFNCILNFESGAFLNLLMLEELDLQETCLTTMDFKTFARLSNLKFLDISFNKLYHLDFYTLYSLIKLEQLFINGNNITNSTGIEEITNILPNLKIFGMYMSNWKCYSLANIFGQLKKKNVTVISPTIDLINGTVGFDTVEGIPCIYNSSFPDIIVRMRSELPHHHIQHFNESELAGHIERKIKMAVAQYSQSESNLTLDRLELTKQFIINETMLIFNEKNKELRKDIDGIITNLTANFTKFEQLINEIVETQNVIIREAVIDGRNKTIDEFDERFKKITEDKKRYDLYQNNIDGIYQQIGDLEQVINEMKRNSTNKTEAMKLERIVTDDSIQRSYYSNNEQQNYDFRSIKIMSAFNCAFLCIFFIFFIVAIRIKRGNIRLNSAHSTFTMNEPI